MRVELRRVNTSEAVVRFVKERIASGSYQPGQRLPSERKLIEQFRISRLSLREGLARLSALGIVTIRHGKGTIVADTVNLESLADVFFPAVVGQGIAHVADLFEARRVVESAMVRRAADRRTEDDLARLAGILAETEASLNDAERFSESDSAFHKEVARIAGNAFLSAMLDTVYTHVDEFIHENVREQATREKALKEHLAVYSAIEAGGAARAEEALVAHLRDCELTYLNRHGDR